MFNVLLHGIGESHRINIDDIACVTWQPPDDAGNVHAKITFKYGALVELRIPSHSWEHFLNELDRKYLNE